MSIPWLDNSFILALCSSLNVTGTDTNTSKLPFSSIRFSFSFILPLFGSNNWYSTWVDMVSSLFISALNIKISSVIFSPFFVIEISDTSPELFALYLTKWKCILLSSEYFSAIIPSEEELYMNTFSKFINIVSFISYCKNSEIYL